MHMLITENVYLKFLNHRGIIKGKPGEKSFAGIRLEGDESSGKAPVETARWPLKSVSSPAVMEV